MFNKLFSSVLSVYLCQCIVLIQLDSLENQPGVVQLAVLVINSRWYPGRLVFVFACACEPYTLASGVLFCVNVVLSD